MLIIMLGLPKCGKTTVASKIAQLNKAHNIFEQIINIDPNNAAENVITKGKIPSSHHADVKIEVWKQGYTMIQESLADSSPNTLILFNTCGTAEYHIMDLWHRASRNHHKIATLYVHRPVAECKKHIDPHVVDGYIPKIKSSAKTYKRHKLFAIRDALDTQQVLECMYNIAQWAQIISKPPEYKPILNNITTLNKTDKTSSKGRKLILDDTNI